VTSGASIEQHFPFHKAQIRKIAKLTENNGISHLSRYNRQHQHDHITSVRDSNDATGADLSLPPCAEVLDAAR
jgi:hypothetical protein